MIRPLRDWVCVEPMTYQHKFLYVAGIQLRKGIIVAAGPGRRMRRKLPYRKNPERSDDVTWFEDGAETGAIRPMRVHVGEVVEFGWRQGQEFRLDGRKLLMIPEQAIYALARNLADEGLMELASMAVDG